MISDNQSICPKCGGQLKYYDHVQRLVRTKFGNKKWVAIERHYIARDNGKTGLAVAFGSTAEESLYDTFDCPMCGCQVIAKERKRDCIPFISTDEEDADDDQI